MPSKTASLLFTPGTSLVFTSQKAYLISTPVFINKFAFVVDVITAFPIIIRIKGKIILKDFIFAPIIY